MINKLIEKIKDFCRWLAEGISDLIGIAAILIVLFAFGASIYGTLFSKGKMDTQTSEDMKSQKVWDGLKKFDQVVTGAYSRDGDAILQYGKVTHWEISSTKLVISKLMKFRVLSNSGFDALLEHLNTMNEKYKTSILDKYNIFGFRIFRFIPSPDEFTPDLYTSTDFFYFDNLDECQEMEVMLGHYNIARTGCEHVNPVNDETKSMDASEAFNG